MLFKMVFGVNVHVLVFLWWYFASSPAYSQTCNCAVRGNEWFSQLCHPGSATCNSVNVALGRPANRYRKALACQTCFAVDGIVPKPNDADCPAAETYPGDHDAWWFVDLGHIYTVSNITIYRRKLWATRMADLQVRVDGQLCYTFPSHSEKDKLHRLPVRIDIQCYRPLTGSVVRLQKVNTDREDAYFTHPISVCEVQVWGCNAGYRGAGCVPCGHCAREDTCHVVTGRCPGGCQPRWQGPQCDGCNAGYRGAGCAPCGQCARNDTCHVVTGRCPGSCQSGWQGPQCDEECDSGTFGLNCDGQCGLCSANITCHHVTGECPTGCQAGYQGTFCNRTCDAGTFGVNCSNGCGQCADNTTCNAETGRCLYGCEAGYRGLLCRESVSESREAFSMPVGPLVGAIIGDFALFGVIITVALILKRKRQTAATEQASASRAASPPNRHVGRQSACSPPPPEAHSGVSSLYDVDGGQQQPHECMRTEDQRSNYTSASSTDAARGCSVYYENLGYLKSTPYD